MTNGQANQEMVERIFAELDAETAEIPPMDARQTAYAVRAVEKAIETLLKQQEEMREALQKCRDQFDFYVSAHMAKQPPDMDKAARNQEFVELCDDVLASLTKPALEDGS